MTSSLKAPPAGLETTGGSEDGGKQPNESSQLIDLVRITASRFWRLVEKTDDCWNWKGASRCGYGAFSITTKKTVGSHRFSYLLHFGVLADGHEVCHRCHNRRCVNPAHLYAGTRSQNMRDAWTAGRTRHSRHAVPPDVSAAILAASKAGKTRNQISRELGVPRTTIFNIVRRGA